MSFTPRATLGLQMRADSSRYPEDRLLPDIFLLPDGIRPADRDALVALQVMTAIVREGRVEADAVRAAAGRDVPRLRQLQDRYDTRPGVLTAKILRWALDPSHVKWLAYGMSIGGDARRGEGLLYRELLHIPDTTADLARVWAAAEGWTPVFADLQLPWQKADVDVGQTGVVLLRSSSTRRRVYEAFARQVATELTVPDATAEWVDPPQRGRSSSSADPAVAAEVEALLERTGRRTAKIDGGLVEVLRAAARDAEAETQTSR